MAKQTYKLSNWRVDSGKGPIGVPYRNKWLYATMTGNDLKDCTIDRISIHFPKYRCTFEPAGELRIKYGGAVVSRKVGSTGGEVKEQTYKNFTGAKDTMFEKGNGEVKLYAYHPYDEGYFAIDDANVTLEVEYTPKTSRLELPEKTVEAGKTLAFAVKTFDDSYTHRATLTMGDKSATVNLAAGETEGAFEVPLDWLTIIPDSTVYNDGTLKLETLKDGNVLGSTTVNGIAMTAPFYSVSISQNVEHMLTVDGVTYPDIAGHWVQGKCGIRVNVTGGSGYYGAKVTASIRIGEKYISGTPPISLESGLLLDRSVRVEVSAYDSRGMTALSRPVMLLIDPYEPPRATLEAWRVNDEGQQDDFGTKGAYKCTYSHSDVGGDNPLTATLSVAGVSEESPPESGELLPSEFVRLDTVKAYDVTLTVSDLYETVTRTVRIPSATFLLHGNAKGNGAGIGHVADVENALVVNPNWAVYMGGMEIVSTLQKLIEDVASLK